MVTVAPLSRRSLRAVWSREKLSGGQAEVEHAHLLFHLPNSWLKGAKLTSVSGGVEGACRPARSTGCAISHC